MKWIWVGNRVRHKNRKGVVTSVNGFKIGVNFGGIKSELIDIRELEKIEGGATTWLGN